MELHSLPVLTSPEKNPQFSVLPVGVRNHRLFQLITKNFASIQEHPPGGGGSSAFAINGWDSLRDAFTTLYKQCSSGELEYMDSVKDFRRRFDSCFEAMEELALRIDDFELHGTIRRGQFGEVRIVKERSSGFAFAMKVLNKKSIIANKDVVFYHEEHAILSKSFNSPWITSLYCSFQDDQSLYFVMEFLPGGDLFNLIEKFDGHLNESMIKFYLAELLLAIDSLHKIGFIHRDVKPDNILLDRLGHIKLADFGSAAKLDQDQKARWNHLPAGTREYIPPEVLREMTCFDQPTKAFGVEIDYWSAGIVAYEMFYGRTPFADDNLIIVCSNIINHKDTLSFPLMNSRYRPSEGFSEVVSGLLEDEDKRLDFSSLVGHSYFSTIDWNATRDLQPPYVPVVKSQDDTSNFDLLDSNPTTVMKNGSGPGKTLTTKSDPTLLKNSNGKPEKLKDVLNQWLPFIGLSFVQRSSTHAEDKHGHEEDCSEECDDYVPTRDNIIPVDLPPPKSLPPPQRSAVVIDGDVDFGDDDGDLLNRSIAAANTSIYNGSLCLEEKLRNLSLKEENQKLKGKLKQIEQRSTLAEETYKLKLKELEDAVTTVEDEKRDVESQLNKALMEVASLNRLIECEHNDRREVETKAMVLLKDIKAKWQREEEKRMKEANQIIESQQIEIASLSAEISELKENMAASSDYETERKRKDSELRQLKGELDEMRAKFAKRQTSSRQSIGEFQSNLELLNLKSNAEIEELRTELNEQIELRNEINGNLSFVQNEKHSLEEQVQCLQAKIAEIGSKARSNSDRQNKAEKRSSSAQTEEGSVVCSEQHNIIKEELNSARQCSMKMNSEIARIEVEKQEQLTELLREKELHFTSRLAELEDELREIHTEKAELVDQVQKLQSASADEKVQLSEMELELESLKLQLMDARMMNAELQQRLRDAEEKMMEAAEKRELLPSELKHPADITVKDKKTSSEPVVMQETKDLKKFSTEQSANLIIESSRKSLLQKLDESGLGVTGCHSGGVCHLESHLLRLEKELTRVREQLVLEREKSRSLRDDQFRKDKELSDAKLDLRIALREGKDLEKTTKEQEAKLKGLKDESRTWILKEKELIRTAEEQKELALELEKEIEKLKQDYLTLQATNDELSLRLKNEFEEKLSALQEREENNSKEAVAGVRKETEQLRAELLALTEMKERSEMEKKKVEKRLETTEVNLEITKKTCSQLEEQLKDLEVMIDYYEKKDNDKTNSDESRNAELVKANAELKAAAKSLNEERSLKTFFEKKSSDLEKRLKALQDETAEETARQHQREQERDGKIANMKKQLDNFQDGLLSSEKLTSNYLRQLEVSGAELINIKEELSDKITQIQSLRDSNYQLTMSLETAVNKGQIYKDHVAELTVQLEELRCLYDDKDLKLTSQINQQNKLIDFLQSQTPNKLASKKKTIGDKLFGQRQKDKENSSSITPLFTPTARRGASCTSLQSRTTDDSRDGSKRQPLTYKQLGKLDDETTDGTEDTPRTANDKKKSHWV